MSSHYHLPHIILISPHYHLFLFHFPYLLLQQVIPLGTSQGPLPPSPTAPPPPPTCDKPHLGSLCGADAIGAIVGIIVGGLLVLALLAAFVYYTFIRVSTLRGTWGKKGLGLS
jgi:hypothetical protein